MSDKPISVGDLVMTVRGHECVLKAVGGIPFVVDIVHPAPKLQGTNHWRCSRCGGDQLFPCGPYVKYSGVVVPLPWLIRIDPPKVSEHERHDEEITA